MEIGEGDPTTLLTRFAEELRRAPSKGGEGNFEGVKPRQEPRPGRGRYGARTRGLRRKGGLTMQGEGPKLCGGN